MVGSCREDELLLGIGTSGAVKRRKRFVLAISVRVWIVINYLREMRNGKWEMVKRDNEQ